MLYLLDPDRESNQAADTGTAAHLAISTYHQGGNADESVRQMRDRLAEFPHADLAQAEEYFRAYEEDSRNTQAEVVQCEWTMDFSLPPHPLDPTNKPIYLHGTCDQIRKTVRGYEVWDYKTGADDGYSMLHEFAPQLAAYTYGASLSLPPGTCHVGGIIRGRGYFDMRGKTADGKMKRKQDPEPDGVFFEACMSFADCEALLYRVRYVVAGVRMGLGLFGPGQHCIHCPHGGLGACIPLSHQLGLRTCD